ncbi:MAG: hypothetical protein HC910_12735 [Spirulinaceae cyanobacterium SM2_1_0]|nr:hypothetical protein [Spirulinaceae cyanobacterium SM2_1_0]
MPCYCDHDESGEPLTVSDSGRDDLFILAWSGLYDDVEQAGLTWQGTRLRFGVE